MANATSSMTSEVNAQSDAGKTHTDPGNSGSSLCIIDEENIHMPALEGATVRFAPPQDVTGERMSFTNRDNEQRVSGEGIVKHGKAKSHKRQSSSYEMRINIPDGLLLNDNRNAIMDDMTGSIPSSKAPRGSKLGTNVPGCFRRLFLNPSYSLRRQMLLTFGSVSTLTILLVMIVSIIASIATGKSIKDESNANIEQWVDVVLSSTSRHVAVALSPKIMPTDLVELMVEIARDRFAGYPTTEDDSLTPFFDTQSQTNIYPLLSDPLPLDWDFRHMQNETGNVNSDNYAEHVQDRWTWYSGNPRLSTASAMYHMQGACDPRVTNVNAMEYDPNCSKTNNDISTGGVVAPSPTNEQVYRKAAALSPFLKALYEYHHIKYIAYCFSNSGAGSSMFFPHTELDSSSSYESIGCEWMRAPNPINPKLGPIGSDEEIARCHSAGTIVRTREYNPLERAWCRDQALDPSRLHSAGPYIDAWTTEKTWTMTAGKAVYDLGTDIFISCINVEFTIDSLNRMLEEVKVDELGILSLVRNDENGTVVTSPEFNLDVADSTTTIDDPALETGVDREMFDSIKSIVDFSLPWDSKNASRLFEATLFDRDQHIISAYPIPSIPDTYDSTYKPEFFAIFSLPKAEGLVPKVDYVNQQVNKSVWGIVLFTVIIGLVGIVAVILLILATASWFSEPLKWMHSVGDQVVGKFGEELDAGIDYEKKKVLTCSPKTELSTLVEEFSKMITRFSGEGTAKRMQINDKEKVNLFDFSDEFAGLYRSRKDSMFAFDYPIASAVSDASDGQPIQQCNLGPNRRSSSKAASASSAVDTIYSKGKAYKSPLFHWMVTLIVTPILVTTVVITAVVLFQISTQLPSFISPVKEEYLKLTFSHRSSVTGLLAARASAVAEKAARDNHLLMRFSSWLLFGSITLSGSFTEVIEGAEECKMAPSGSECEWGRDFSCDCGWNDFTVRGKENACTKYPPGMSRPMQNVYFEAQSQDVDPSGFRYSTSFPEVALYPNTTAWWDNITVLPQATNVEYARPTYGTPYDRVKTISALSTVFIPLYNYDKSNNKPLALYIAFEADGMFAGYMGCDKNFVNYPFWRSTEDNRAAELRPELCPLGKYGYDPRCRGWYAGGRSNATLGGALHITPPYLFSQSGGGGVVGQSITSPLVDPQSNQHVGQVLIDFLPESIFRELESGNTKLSEGGFPIMITPARDILGHDTVVGPGFSLKEGGKAIEDLLLADDAFDLILQEMKAGKRGNGTFSAVIGNRHEQFEITYAPVIVRSYYPLNSSDIASGVKNETTLVYSLALVETDHGILSSFRSIEANASKTVNICLGVLSALIFVSIILIVYIAFRVTTSMTGPILQLLDVIKDINCMHTSNDVISKLSNYKGSCREVDSVYKTMEMLYKVVQYANAAFFSGDLQVAYHVLRDALRLFTRLDNKKAIAVTRNNLGNTMLTIYRTMKASGCEEMCGMSKKEVIEKGTAYYAHSIKLGEAAYDQFYNDAGWSEECLVFMQFLANRYFNRAIFFLTTRCDHENQEEAESLGFRDLQITSDMDVEIVDQCLEMGFKINRTERYELMMSRVRGLLALVELGYSPDVLFVEDHIANLYQDLKNAMKNPSHELFKEISVAGRMQKLDVELMKYFSLAKHDNVNAARVAIRMLIEDEWIFPDAEQEAVLMLLSYMNATDDENCPEDKAGHMAKELRSTIEMLEHELSKTSFNDSRGDPGITKSLTVSIRSSTSRRNISERSVGGNAESTSRGRRSSALRESSRRDVTMELF
mmetsp:Transcript_18225/g.39386  ORF Transcript_18225/g.39386 Transcript_18225/m.39386 type:complete len:1769 (-) Transcript_18225:63-5369(-)|eukprot:CAMPEP_0172311836 /NCGR_PEP_ID=MMETSP1058-20130122/15803_1 /TAXON_ID=83371 /ORGANISM="Detonula confervacea, Strain CCMP 353" /LENGTH=1768 /DNA_ID=CAMNT_0013025131 /DNA_START=188 /DNA_END=5494 /DNA_ORIENTATION=-